jgi:two-component system chemotaxis response regulator CheB
MPHLNISNNIIRLMVIDEEVLVRQLISRVLSDDKQIEIVGTYSSISNISDTISKAEPDIVLLDISGKKVNGMDTLAEINRLFPLLPVVVLSERTEHGASKALEAVEDGAWDFITKPEKQGIILFADRHFRKRIGPAIKSAVKAHRLLWEDIQEKKVKGRVKEITSFQEIPVKQKIDIVVMGGCSGGPKALLNIIPRLPADFPVPVIISQHMPKIYTKVFAEKLNKVSHIQVDEAYAGARLQSGQVWIAPGGYHIMIKSNGLEDVISLHKGPRENTCRPSIDILFRSAADVFGSHVLGVLLSGRGRDGVLGSRYIHSNGGQILVQDRSSSLTWELPELIVNMDLAHGILPLDQMAEGIIDVVTESQEVSVGYSGKNKSELDHGGSEHMSTSY